MQGVRVISSWCSTNLTGKSGPGNLEVPQIFSSPSVFSVSSSQPLKVSPPWLVEFMALRTILAVILVSLLMAMLGCTSIRHTFDVEDHTRGSEGFYKNKIYVGVRSILDPRFPFLYLSHAVVTILDLPFSFILDTLLLPYTIPVTKQNLSDAKPVDAVCFLLGNLRPMLVSMEGRRFPDVFTDHTSGSVLVRREPNQPPTKPAASEMTRTISAALSVKAVSVCRG